jgi:NAD(P)-dependent dehydrogenase (short-subunit alcohol dehydrogenase family)
MRLENRVALVTGSASGIGKAIALALAREGAKLVVNDVDEAAMKATVAEITAKGVEAIGVQADVTESSAVTRMVDRVKERFGRIDVLVNNAGGSMNHPVRLLEISEEMWDQVVDLNLKSTFLVSKAVLPTMIEQRSGNIVNVSSLAGRYGNETARPHYSAAKAGVLGLTRHMSREFGPHGIRVNAVCPGYCFSGERIAEVWAQRPNRDQMIATVALRRVSTPDEQADVVVFLASDESRYVTGATIDVAGGRVPF